MVRYIIRRVLYMIPITIVLSFVCFLVVDMAPGDFVTQFEIAVKNDLNMTEDRRRAQLSYLEELRALYGLEKPVAARYATWVFNIVTRGDFGYSFQVMRPVSTLIMERLGWTVLMGLIGLFIGLVVSFSIGVYSATHQYGPLDYAINIIAFIGMATPSFFLALLLMVFAVFVLKINVGGLFSSQFVGQPWSLAKVWDLLTHIWIPIVVGIITGTGGSIRVIRGNLLDKLHAQYVQTARAKGMPERTVIYKHALRTALHPWIMGMGGVLSGLISGDTIMGVVLRLPTVGYLYYQALVNQDSYVAGTFLFLTTMLFQIGNLGADLALAAIDPTISYE